MTAQQAIDERNLLNFVGRGIGDVDGLTSVAPVVIGDTRSL
jgi:hypothetical protein